MDPKAHLSGIFLKLIPLLACLCLLLLYAVPTVSAQDELELTVTKDSTAAGSYSDPITYTIGVAAVITGAVTRTVTLTDTLPGGADYTITSSIWGCDIDHPGNPGNLVTVSVPLGGTETLVCQTNMTDGDSAPLIITGTVNTTDAAVVTNTVTVSGDGGEGEASDSAGLTLNQPPIPTLNEWGMLILLAGLTACTVVYLRKRRAV